MWLLAICFVACQSPTSSTPETPSDTPTISQQVDSAQVEATPNSQKKEPTKKGKKIIGHGFDFENNGKSPTVDLKSVYTKEKLDSIQLLSLVTDDFRSALYQNKKYLKKVINKKGHKVDGLKFTNKDLYKTMRKIRDQKTDVAITDLVDAYKIYGEDKMGNVHFTSYFTPILKVKNKPDEEYKYPIYKKPTNWKGKLPTRKQIDGDGVLKGKGLELAWSNSLEDIHFMMVQGSGYVEYPDGRQKMMLYGGKNGHKYVSLGRYLVERGEVPAEEISLSTIKQWCAENPDSVKTLLYRNPSYVFFTPSNTKTVGAANVELADLHSVAVDRKLIPLGSILLGKVPVLDAENHFLKHEYRLLVAQDVGGAIKGSHIDIYAGVGERGKRLADAMHHYGQIWLLLPKK